MNPGDIVKIDDEPGEFEFVKYSGMHAVVSHMGSEQFVLRHKIQLVRSKDDPWIASNVGCDSSSDDPWLASGETYCFKATANNVVVQDDTNPCADVLNGSATPTDKYKGQSFSATILEEATEHVRKNFYPPKSAWNDFFDNTPKVTDVDRAKVAERFYSGEWVDIIDIENFSISKEGIKLEINPIKQQIRRTDIV